MSPKKKSMRYDNIAYVFLLPNYIIFVVFLLIPIIWTIVLSFTNYDLTEYHFIGFDNYAALLKDQVFLKSLANTFQYCIITIPSSMVLGLLIALAVNKKCYCKGILRMAFYMPNILSIVAASMAWLYMYDTNAGMINRILKLAGGKAVPWLTSPDYAMASVCIVGIWCVCGYNMVIFLSGLQSIPVYLYEAARIDGASALQQFRYITLPMLSPTTFFIFVMACINSFQVFGQVYIITNGGPSNATTTLAHQIYKNGFELYHMGYASSMAVVLMLFILLITFLNMTVNRRGMAGDES